MGVATIMTARKIYLLAWGDDKADIIKKAVEDKVSDTLPASYLQMHNNANVLGLRCKGDRKRDGEDDHRSLAGS